MKSLANRLGQVEARYGGVDLHQLRAEIEYDRWRQSLTPEDHTRNMELHRSKLLGKPLTPAEEAELASWREDPRASAIDRSDWSDDELRETSLKYLEQFMVNDYHDVCQRWSAELWPRGHHDDTFYLMESEAFGRAEEWFEQIRALGADPVEVMHSRFPETYRYYLREQEERNH